MQCIVNGIMTEYTKVGSGPVVVVLHGWGTSAANMQPVTDGLADTFTVIALDLPGFGGTERPREVWGVEEYTRFVMSVLEKLEATHVHAMIGHSFGGRICIKASGQKIISPEKVVLIGSAGIKHSASARNAAYKFIAKAGKIVLSLPGLRSLRAVAQRKLYARAGASDYLQAGAMRDIFSKVIDEGLQADAAAIAQPTLLIWGENDQDAPVSDARQLNSLIRGSELHIVVHAGHFVHSEQPAVVVKYIREFL